MENIDNFVQWCNINNGCIMVALTFIYVVATILICIFNYKSAKATKEQIKESYKQFIENTRAHIIPKINELEGEVICLVFENIGKEIANEVEIDVKEEWLKRLEKTKTFPEVADSLRQIKNKKLFFTVDQKMYYGLCIPGNGCDDFKEISEEDLVIIIKYKSLNRYYEEKYTISLGAYNYMVDQSDYTRLTKKQIQELKIINKNLKDINNSIKTLNINSILQ